MGIRIGSACALVALATAASSARANMLANGGLELNSSYSVPGSPGFVTAGPITNNTALPGWTITTGTVDVVPTSYWHGTQGNYSVDMVGSPGLGSIRQLVSTTQSGNDYSMTFDWAPNPVIQGVDESLTTKILLIQAFNAAGTVKIAQQVYFLLDGLRTRQNMQFVADHFDFTATGPTLIVVSAVQPMDLPSGESASNMYMGPVIDNLDLELAGHSQPTGGESVPEPASLAVAGLCAMGLLVRRRRTVKRV